MNNCNSSNNYSSRSRRSHQKQPVYTSDKRAKFTQRENKKWIRFLTVLGYIFFVSFPALSLSVYYVYVWDPNYMDKVALNESVDYPAKYFEPISPQSNVKPLSVDNVKTTQMEADLATILAEGKASMESSSEIKHAPGRN